MTPYINSVSVLKAMVYLRSLFCLASQHAKSCDSFSNFQSKFIRGQLTPICSRASFLFKAQDAKTETGA